ncbi:MAG: hypothetical protein RLZZ50_1197 [Verrucomicrobiota bacterium]
MSLRIFHCETPLPGVSRSKTKTTNNDMKSRIQIAGTVAALATAAAVQAEVKINDSLSLDGYAIGSGVVTEGTDKGNDKLGKSGGPYDSAYIAVNGSYKDFTSKVSLYSVNFGDNNTGDDVGILDAYVTYKTGNLSLTGAKYLGWLGFESFHSVNNAFISFSQAGYASPFATGVKADYAGEGFSTGVSVRDSQVGPGGNFFEGDGEFSDDLGYEAYVMLTSIEKLTVFAGAGFEDVDGGDQTLTYDLWASYALSDSVSLAAEYAYLEEVNNGSWLLQGTYKVSEPLSVSGRLTGSDGDNGSSDSFGYGIASTYAINSNFAIKGEVTKTDNNAGGNDPFTYALQGQFKF